MMDQGGTWPQARVAHCAHRACYPWNADGRGGLQPQPAGTSAIHLLQAGVGMAWGPSEDPGAPAPLSFLGKQESVEDREAGPAQTGPTDTPCHACARVPAPGPATAILGPPLGPQTRPAGWGLEGAPRGHHTRTVGAPWMPGQSWPQAPGPRPSAFAEGRLGTRVPRLARAPCVGRPAGCVSHHLSPKPGHLLVRLPAWASTNRAARGHPSCQGSSAPPHRPPCHRPTADWRGEGGR